MISFTFVTFINYLNANPCLTLGFVFVSLYHPTVLEKKKKKEKAAAAILKLCFDLCHAFVYFRALVSLAATDRRNKQHI